MQITRLLEGQYINPKMLVCVIALDAINYKHYINKWKEQGQVINACLNRKPRSAVIFQNNLVLITSVASETIYDRLCAMDEN